MEYDSRKAEVYCPVCGNVTLVVRRPLFDGLKKVGEKLSCTVCRTEFEDDAELEFVERRAPRVFSEEDSLRLCRHCAHYIVNPFTQRCMLHLKEVEATDTCERFVRRSEKKSKSSDGLKELFGQGPEPGAPEKS